MNWMCNKFFMEGNDESLSQIGKVMKKAVLILNVIFCALMLYTYIFWVSDRFLWRGYKMQYAFTIYLPLAIAAVLNIIGGLFIWKNKRVLWAVIALAFTVIVLVFYFIGLYAFPHKAFL